MTKQKYSAEDGLKILNYLGITNITEQEKKVFEEKWEEFYTLNDQDLISTTWQLYSKALPFICGDGNRGSFVCQTIRDSDFGKRLEVTGLNEELEKGKSLDEILKKGPHQFIKQGTISDFITGKISPCIVD